MLRADVAPGGEILHFHTVRKGRAPGRIREPVA
jgi:hypothetical protein